MRLKVTCENCAKSINVSKFTFIQDRVELFNKVGKQKIKCKKCGNVVNYHVNKVYASHNVLLEMILFLIVLISTFLILKYSFFNVIEKTPLYSLITLSVSLIPSGFYLTYVYSVNKNVRTFNGYKLKE